MIPRQLVRRVSVDRVVVLVGFALTRAAYWFAGVRFDASGIDYSSQLLDPTLLRDRLFESVWYLHSQPPAFNLFVGVVLRLSPFGITTSFHLTYLVCGLVLLFAIHDLGRLLGLGRRTAIVVALVICCAPTVVLYENWLSYEYPVAAMLVLMVDLCARYARRPAGRLLIGVMCVASLATLTRSLLHPVWLIAVFVCVVFYRRPLNSRTVGLAMLPMLLVGAVIVKNQAVFATPQLSSWFGYNLHHVVVGPLTDAQKQRLAEEGFLAATPPPCVPRHPDILATADQYKQDWRGRDEGAPNSPTFRPAIENFNYECLIGRYNALGADAATVARRHPGWVMRNEAGGYEIWASPASVTPFVFGNRNAIDIVDSSFRKVVLLDVAWDPPVAIPQAWPVAVSAPDHRFHLSIVLIIATIITMSAAAVALLRWRRRTDRSLPFIVAGGTVAFVTIAGNMFEYGENNRIRFIVEPLTFLIAALVINAALTALRTKRMTPPGSADDHSGEGAGTSTLRTEVPNI